MSIRFNQDSKIFEIDTNHTSYVFGINQSGGIQHLYWGNKVKSGDCNRLLVPMLRSSLDLHIENEREEYSPWGGMFYAEPGLKLSFSDGVRDLKMSYASHEIKEDSLIITLKDEHYPLEVDLVYMVKEQFDLIERNAIVRNVGKDPIMLENTSSAVWMIPDMNEYQLTYSFGYWGGETQIKKQNLSEGKMVLESRKGITSHNHNPWFAIDNGNASEESGEVWYGALAWSGNWKIVIERNTYNNLRVVGGINDFDFSWLLEGGEIFETPVFVGGFSDKGFGHMSRNMHLYERNCILPKKHANTLRKVLYNSWEATGFSVNAENQISLAQKAAQIGVELFVIDDGWFGKRNNDKAGLGDWQINKEKFPEGLTHLIKSVRDMGMEFGIWVEPEMVNPDSDLYRTHPDWVLGFSTRKGSLGRNQLVLNLAKDEVKTFILSFMTELLSEYDIKFIKWDMNRAVSEPGWNEAPLKRQREVLVKYTKNLYEIWRTLKEKFPHVMFESCSGGGGRIDLGIMEYADQFWVSDNTDALDRLYMQEGFSTMYNPKTMVCWVTDSPNGFNKRNLSLKYRFLSSMTGALGVGGNLRKWSDESLEDASRYIAVYKQIRDMVQNGSLYRLSPPSTGNTVVQYVEDKGRESVVFMFNQSLNFGMNKFHVRLKGLFPDVSYKVTIDEEEPFTMSGSGLMNVGLTIKYKGEYDCKLIRIVAE